MRYFNTRNRNKIFTPQESQRERYFPIVDGEFSFSGETMASYERWAHTHILMNPSINNALSSFGTHK